MPTGMAFVPSGPRLIQQFGVQRIGASQAGLGQDVSLAGRTNFGAAKSALQRQFLDIEGIYGKDIAMDDLIVPWRAGTVVAVVVTAHVVVAGKPVSVVIDALPAAMGGLRAWFAARRYISAEFALLDRGDCRRQVDQNPVKEIDAWQRGRNAAAFLIDVVAAARNVWVVTDQRKGFCPGRYIAPGKLGILVLAYADIVSRVGNAKGKNAR